MAGLYILGSLKSSSHQNGGSDSIELSHREKRHYTRQQQLSPSYQSERDIDRPRERGVRSGHSTDRARSLEVSDRERESRDNQYPFMLEGVMGPREGDTN
ncbi:hypothetical protein Phum_PHUM116860 [Pediculus humanus corporis]|uniref:Uncharacterized protein n=1 Tax=Pediculus humanus subsp. corporis TaxID=121224 RepID=E0VDI6_PEDHC|nr:uncharacterized protein Phum_PHUM116860 [Pediculus humanus corporis]EEB11442.1 hypothetical protein Phum_PHUM116860 [Pediculus humanus corporis]